MSGLYCLSWNKKGVFDPATKMMLNSLAVQHCTNDTGDPTTEFKFACLEEHLLNSSKIVIDALRSLFFHQIVRTFVLRPARSSRLTNHVTCETLVSHNSVANNLPGLVQNRSHSKNQSWIFNSRIPKEDTKQMISCSFLWL